MTETPEEAPKPMIVTARRYIDPDQMKEDVSINPTDLDSAFIAQSSLYAYYGEQAARANAQVDRFKHMLEVMQAKVSARLRNEAAIKGEKTTEKGLEQAVALHPSILAMNKALIEAKEIADVAKSTLEALKQRRDMLIQAGVDRREDKKGDLRLKAIEASHAATKDSLVARARALAQHDE